MLTHLSGLPSKPSSPKVTESAPGRRRALRLFYFAYETERVSRITVILTWPG